MKLSSNREFVSLSVQLEKFSVSQYNQEEI